MKQWMEEEGLLPAGDVKVLASFYLKKLKEKVSEKEVEHNILIELVLWGDFLLSGVEPPPGVIWEIWQRDVEYARCLSLSPSLRPSSCPSPLPSAALPVILATPFYLDHLDQKWTNFYEVDLKQALGIETFLGGEACMWTEVVDESNVLSRSFPRASAVAERLWCAECPQNYRKATGRLARWRCRFGRRGEIKGVSKRLLYYRHRREGLFLEPLGNVEDASRVRREEEEDEEMLNDDELWFCREKGGEGAGI